MNGTGVENVWDYPRPPAVTSCRDRVRVELAGEVAEGGAPSSRGGV
jgi:hypothetical protein